VIQILSEYHFIHLFTPGLGPGWSRQLQEFGGLVKAYWMLWSKDEGALQELMGSVESHTRGIWTSE
jgi:hypothetical protein